MRGGGYDLFKDNICKKKKTTMLKMFQISEVIKIYNIIFR